MSKKKTTTRRKHRTPQEKIEDLQKEIERIKQAQKVKSSPGLKQAKLGLAALKRAQPLAKDEGDDALMSALVNAIAALEGAFGKVAGGVPVGRVRRTAADIEAMQEKIAGFLADNPGVGIGPMADELGESTKDVRGPLMEMLEDGRVSKKGERRATVYSLARGRARRR